MKRKIYKGCFRKTCISFSRSLAQPVDRIESIKWIENSWKLVESTGGRLLYRVVV